MKFLLTNDDGIEASGLQALVAAADPFGESTIVAPAGPQSGVSHAVSEGAVLMEERGPRRLAVHGTPAESHNAGAPPNRMDSFVVVPLAPTIR